MGRRSSLPSREHVLNRLGRLWLGRTVVLAEEAGDRGGDLALGERSGIRALANAARSFLKDRGIRT